MISDFSMRGRKKISYFFQLLKYNKEFNKNNPDYFRPDGLLVFVGSQGSGKTLSAVNYVYVLLQLYPKCKLVTNIDLKDFPIDNIRVFRFNNAEDLKKYKNGRKGVIFLIDEIHLYFNSLESKNINIDVMTQIAQQRKQRIHIVATSQVFGRMAKPLREQFSSIILCRSYFNFIQKNSLIDRDSIDSEASTGTNLSGKVVRNYWWFRSPKMFDRYDTYCVISNENIKANRENQDIYNERGGSSAS